MTKRKSLITNTSVKFCNPTFDEANNTVVTSDVVFDARHDFFVDSGFCGIIAKVSLSREPSEEDIRKQLSLTLVDNITCQEVASFRTEASMSKHEYSCDIHVLFPSDSVDLIPGHSYKLTVSDEGCSETLYEDTFRLFGLEHGYPDEWYTVIDGGVKFTWDDACYKSLDTYNYHAYEVRFKLNHNFGENQPDFLPELEVRLHYPDGKHCDVKIQHPYRAYFVDYGCIAEIPLMTTEDTNGVFYAEVLCMQYVLGGFVFSTDHSDEEGSWSGSDIEALDEYSLEAATERLNKLLPDSPIPNLDVHISHDFDSRASETVSLDRLIGLTEVKRKLDVYERLVRFNNMRRDNGLSCPEVPLHAMFLGSPGTGKTTVAKSMGEMLKQAGVLSKGHVVVRERATLLGINYSSESENTLKALEEARGGILFIDEAYQLYQPCDPRDPGKFVIETLLTALADESNRDWMLILAGYPDKMRQMLLMNPGFKSRIPESNIYQFEDFSTPELMQIADNFLKRYDYALSEGARDALADRLNYAHRDETFGNARYVLNLITTEILPAMAVRVTKADVQGSGDIDNSRLTLIEASDIPQPIALTSKSERPRIGFRA